MSTIVTDEQRSLHYRTLPATCQYCGETPTHIRVTVMEGGDAFVSALCEVHMRGELAHCTTGMRNPTGTSDFYPTQEEPEEP